MTYFLFIVGFFWRFFHNTGDCIFAKTTALFNYTCIQDKSCAWNLWSVGPSGLKLIHGLCKIVIYVFCTFRKFQSCSFCPFSWWQCTSQRVGYFQNANDAKVYAKSRTLHVWNSHLTIGATSWNGNASTDVNESINARTEICSVSQRSRYKPWKGYYL